MYTGARNTIGKLGKLAASDQNKQICYRKRYRQAVLLLLFMPLNLFIVIFVAGIHMPALEYIEIDKMRQFVDEG